jgi:1-acyl-sn-glycerol-3-phosphate acyltransferase
VTTPRRTRARRAARLARHLGSAYASAVLRTPRLEPAGRRRLVADLAREMLDVLEVRLIVRGAPPAGAPALVVANHVSWLDMYVLNAVAGARFVAKSEVQGWPGFGTIADRFGTFFIVRGSYRDAARVRTAAARALAGGERVAVFPEGTTTDGTTVGHFYPALFQSAIDAGAPVQPVAIRYLDACGRRSHAPVFVGDTTILESLTQVLRQPWLAAEVTFGPALPPAGRTRRELAELARWWVRGTLGLPREPQAERRRAA